MKRISRILQIPESALNHYLRANDTAEKSRGGYETKKYKIELDDDDEEDLEEECETVADAEDNIEEVTVAEEEGREEEEEEDENVINITPPKNDSESDADNANYWQDSDYEGEEGEEGENGAANQTINQKGNIDMTIASSRNVETVANAETGAGPIKIEYEKRLLEHEIEMRKMRRELKKRENEIEYLRTQIRIQDMIYFEKYLPFAEFIQNIIQRYQRGGGQQREEYEKMSDEWKQYLEVLPNYEIKNLIYYIQNTDNITPDFRDNFYRIFKEYYDYLTRMKEENIYTSRRNKIQDMWREWSKYAKIFINIQSFDNVNKFRRLIDHQKKRETIEETILLGHCPDPDHSIPGKGKAPNIRSRQMEGIAGKVAAAAARCATTGGAKKKKDVIALDI